MPPRPHGRGVLRRRTKAANRGVLTPQNARVGRPACNISAGIGFTKTVTVPNSRARRLCRASGEDCVITLRNVGGERGRWRLARRRGYVSPTLTAGGVDKSFSASHQAACQAASADLDGASARPDMFGEQVKGFGPPLGRVVSWERRPRAHGALVVRKHP